MKDRGEPSLPGLLLGMGLFVVLGAPLVYFVWEFLNGLLAGRPDPTTGLYAGVAAVGLAFLLLFLGRRVGRWQGGDSG